ncbi:SpoIIE family protein phosphatase [Halothiobacillus sp. DCM-1]|uniref:SpoIIE family protein phosphatase n=1 Tax=Halothiobacillus sp. DCM-1 TaxID=3112558 RepID=UPI003245DD24
MSIARKILLPILLMALVVLSVMVAFVTYDTDERANQDERRELSLLGLAFDNELTTLNGFALGLAVEVANNPGVQQAMANRNRAALEALVMPGYQALRKKFEIAQYQFHIPPAISFLRVHDPAKFGDDLSAFRPIVVAANREDKSLSGIEVGRAGFGIRGIAPIRAQGVHVGTVEFGIDIGNAFLTQLKQRYGADWQVLLSSKMAQIATFTQGNQPAEAGLIVQSSTLTHPFIDGAQALAHPLNGQAFDTIEHREGREFRVRWMPLNSFNGEQIGWVQILKDRSDFVTLRNTRLMQAVGMIVLVLASLSLLVSVVVTRVLRPLKPLTSASAAIARGDFTPDLAPYAKSSDEIGQLARGMQSMSEQLSVLVHHLEEQVSHRTAELHSANERIQQLNQSLRADNQRMRTELDVARKIQHMIVPGSHEISSVPTLDIAAYMEPAEEVGGDYYDILQHDGQVCIGIGDVTGHGLESGLVMLMTQSAVRTLITLNETDPVRLMNTLNRTLFNNMQRMRSEKNLTLSLLHYQPDPQHTGQGQLRIIGQHESVLIIRADGQFQDIDTLELGMPIGMIDDIAQFIAAAVVTLNTGDAVVLYTDGITEAANAAHELFGSNRLKQTLLAHHQQPAEAIKTAVIEAVRAHIGAQALYDDLTLIVLKQR